MTRHEIYEKKTEELLLPILEKMNLELVDVEFVKEAGEWYLRIYIDKEGGMDLDTCEKVSNAFSALLDEEEYIDEAYMLEVSSPGLGRALKKERDYERNLGKDIELRLFGPVDKKKEFIGTLTAYTGETVTLLSEEKERTFKKEDIALIREYVDWNA